MRRRFVYPALVLLAACASQREPTPPPAYMVTMPPPCTGDPSQAPAPCTDTSGGGAPDYSYDNTPYASSPTPFMPFYTGTPVVPIMGTSPAQPVHPTTPQAKPKPVKPAEPIHPCPRGPKVCP